MSATAYTGPFPCNLTRTMADVMADERPFAIVAEQSGADAAAIKSGSGVLPATLDRTGAATPRHEPASVIRSRDHFTSADDEYWRAISRAAGAPL